MKLYREVEQKETCGYYLYKDHPNYTEPLWTTHLAPIEITEEEIEEIVQDMAQDDEYGEWGRECAREAIRMVLSKLKGDEL
jgi:hypothetical protein